MPEIVSSTPGADLSLAIKRRIERKTWGRIHHLRVLAEGNRVSVRGFTFSYYLKLLAIEAAKEELDPRVSSLLDVDIQVSSEESQAPVGQESKDNL